MQDEQRCLIGSQSHARSRRRTLNQSQGGCPEFNVTIKIGHLKFDDTPRQTVCLGYVIRTGRRGSISHGTKTFWVKTPRPKRSEHQEGWFNRALQLVPFCCGKDHAKRACNFDQANELNKCNGCILGPHHAHRDQICRARHQFHRASHQEHCSQGRLRDPKANVPAFVCLFGSGLYLSLSCHQLS